MKYQILDYGSRFSDYRLTHTIQKNLLYLCRFECYLRYQSHTMPTPTHKFYHQATYKFQNLLQIFSSLYLLFSIFSPILYQYLLPVEMR